MGEGHAAFFDILAPPYHTEVHEDEIEDLRECHFFRCRPCPFIQILSRIYPDFI